LEPGRAELLWMASLADSVIVWMIDLSGNDSVGALVAF
jgi:hypothetical protein